MTDCPTGKPEFGYKEENRTDTIQSSFVPEYKEAVLNTARQDKYYQVFEHFGFTPSKKPQKENPFREERTNSFYINPEGFFKDFGDDNLKGDGIKFIQLYCKVGFADALKITADIYNIPYEGEGIVIKTVEKSGRKALKKQRKKRYNFTSKAFRNYLTNKEKAYWKKKTAAGSDTVLKYLKPTAGVEMQFAVEIVKGEKYFVIQPKKTVKTVWKGDKTLDELRESGKLPTDFVYSLGINELEPDKPVILCEGEKDFIALKHAGYNVFTLGSAKSKIPDFILSQLEAKNINTQNVYILFDTDFTGIEDSFKLAKNHGCKILQLPKLKQQLYRYDKNRKKYRSTLGEYSEKIADSSLLEKPRYNDVCDYLELYGFDKELRNLLNVPLNKSYKIEGLEFDDIPTYTLGPNQYIANLIECTKSIIDANKFIQFKADPGMGKSVASIVTIPQMFPKAIILFIANTKDQVSQLSYEIGQKDHFRPISNKVKLYTDKGVNTGNKQIHIAHMDKAEMAFKNIKDTYPEREVIIIKDESHAYTTDYNFRTFAIKQCNNVSKKADKVISFSATPDYHHVFTKDIPLIVFNRKENPLMDISIIEYKMRLFKAAYHAVKKAIIEGKDGKIVVRLLNKKTASKVRKMLIKEGILEANQMDTYYADKAKRPILTRTKENIKKHGLIPSEVKLLFTTNVFDLGINIYNTDIDRIISFQSKESDNCLMTSKQFPQRFRKLEKINYYIYRPEREQQEWRFCKKTKYYDSLCNAALAKLDIIKCESIFQKEKLKENINYLEKYSYDGINKHPTLKHNDDLTSDFKILSFEDEKLSINTNYITYLVHRNQYKNLGINLFSESLIDSIPNSRLILKGKLDELSAQESEKIETISKEVNQEIKDFEENAIRTIDESADLYFNAVKNDFSDKQLEGEIKKYTQRDLPDVSLSNLLDVDSSFISENEEIILTQSKRYFHLNDFGIKHKDNCKLLLSNTDCRKFSNIHKGLINHKLLHVYEKTGADLYKIYGDKRLLNQAETLQKIVDRLTSVEGELVKNKRSDEYLKKISDIENSISKTKEELSALKAFKSISNRDKQRNEAKIKTRLNRIKSYNEKLSIARGRYDNSVFENALTLSQLSSILNECRDFKVDRQPERVNLRITESFFNCKVKVIDGETFVSLGERFTLEAYLKHIGVDDYNAPLQQINTEITESKEAIETAKKNEENEISLINNINIPSKGNYLKKIGIPYSYLLNRSYTLFDDHH